MEGLLARPLSLLDALWQAERDAQPLETPEAKAGLKARLMAHVDTIEDNDVRALYRRDLLDRFSAFAYPPRAPRQKQAKGPWRANTSSAPQTLSPAARETLQHMLGGAQRASLLSAVVAGLLRHPDAIEVHHDALLKLAIYRLSPDPQDCP